MPEISLITTCMGRLSHLRESLPAAVAQPRVQCIVVDYSCPEGAGRWAQETFPAVKVIHAPGRERFNVSQARNLGAQAAEAPWLCFVDADVILAPDFSQTILPLLQPGHFYRPHPIVRELCGTVAVARDAFERVGGYDEMMRGWGGEDRDLYDRLRLFGQRETAVPAALFRTIPHGDDLRTQNYDNHDLPLNQAINRVYRQAKLDLMRLHGGMLEPALRSRLYDDVLRFVSQWQAHGQSTLRLDVHIEKTWLGPQFSCALLYTLGPTSA